MKCPNCGIELEIVKAGAVEQDSDVWRDDPATERQIGFLGRYGIDGHKMTKDEASKEIDRILKKE